MEDTHGAAKYMSNKKNFVVLILIIMEDTHGGSMTAITTMLAMCLNPYYNGRYSWSQLSVYHLNVHIKS